MTKKIVTRALAVAGLLVGTVSMSFAQGVAAQTRRVAAERIDQQPVVAAAVALEQGAMLKLTADQRAQLSSAANEAVALQNERTRLWQEYRALVARPDFSEDMAAQEAAPRMLRIVGINSQLSAISARQDRNVATILNSDQRLQLARMVTATRAAL